MAGATNRSALVSTEWLQTVIDSNAPNYRILNASWYLPSLQRNPEQEYKRQHIPGAMFYDMEECIDKSDDIPFMLPPAEFFERYAGDLGISNDTHVVLYDNHPTLPVCTAQRIWWTFRVFGHDKVSVLEGGLRKWIAEERPTTDRVENVPKETFHAQFQPHLVKNISDVENNLKEALFQLADGRPEGRYNGTTPELKPGVKPGCIPDAVNIPFMTALNLEDQCVKSPEELKKLFENKGIDLNKPLVVHCTYGTTATVLALAAFECGNDQVAVYDGSWTEWYLKAPDELKKNVPTD